MQIAVFITLLTYLILFFLAGLIAAREAGRSIWLFGTAQGRERLAALGFRAAFALAGLGAVINIAHHDHHGAAGLSMAHVLLGLILANTGAMIAFAAQLSMGASWRVGVQAGAVGALVKGGLYRFSRNPTFVGQGLLLAGVFLAAPSLLTLAGLALFLWSAHTQVLSEEVMLLGEHGADYAAFKTEVPRWF